ncbi:HSP20-like chaperones superfamily protein [Raphanus sativus]|uniref:Inactive protein RESTRICTED TEV MOVEMENT 2-like n=1 Tax=Raphanus sativus TaxID=3726 RepID=A0A9W3DFB8_RAPSA|nr:inactive protein RESTRICTED TEV MOVEMENT 2-like [Raphanus sativus]KAJ4906253.1 HSP20-like chaperones superfamily protein [Raphanus sativus]
MERKSDNATANRIYDEFDPIFNWKTEQGFETLTIYLPGFRKEQLKVQVTTTRKVRVMGERPAGANKWIRFRKEFPIQANIDVDSIGAKFEGANLVVKLPRLPMGRGGQTSPIGTTAKPPPVPKETSTKEKEAGVEKHAEKAQLPKPPREEETKRAEKEKALKATEKENVCDGVKQDYRSKVNAYKENLGGYVALMKNNQRAITLGMVAPAAAVLLLSLGFYAGQMFTS